MKFVEPFSFQNFFFSFNEQINSCHYVDQIRKRCKAIRSSQNCNARNGRWFLAFSSENDANISILMRDAHQLPWASCLHQSIRPSFIKSDLNALSPIFRSKKTKIIVCQYKMLHFTSKSSVTTNNNTQNTSNQLKFIAIACLLLSPPYASRMLFPFVNHFKRTANLLHLF